MDKEGMRFTSVSNHVRPFARDFLQKLEFDGQLI